MRGRISTAIAALLVMGIFAVSEQTWINSWCASAIDETPGAPGEVTIYATNRYNTPVQGVFLVTTTIGLNGVSTTIQCSDFRPPRYVPPKTDLNIITSTASLDMVTMAFEILTIKE